MRATLAVLLLALLAFAAAGPAAAKRVALLIGNADYVNDRFDLRNPVNDVRALDAALVRLGFEVLLIEDQDVGTMRETLARFSETMRGAEIGLFFYAGHGVQVNGDNLLLASELRDISRDAVSEAALTLSEVRVAFEAAGPDLGMIILDACRDNPVAAVEEIVDGRGLTRSSGGAGLLIAYATDPGAVAFDGAGDNSVFTEAMLDHLATPGLDVRLMLGRVRQQVVLETGGTQVPWVEESVLGEFYLNTEPTEFNRAALVDRDVARWREVSGSLQPGPYRAYLEEFPDGLFRDFAERRLARFSMVPITNPLPSAGGFDPESFVAEAEPERLATALRLLGFLPPEAPVETAQLRRSLEAYVARSAEPESFDGQQVFVEAARLNVFFGVRVGDRIELALRLLKGIDLILADIDREYARALDDAKADIAAGRFTEEELRAVLDEEVAGLRAAEEEALTRLDQYRTYYEELIGDAGTHFGTLMTPAIMGLDQPGRQLGTIGEQAQQDIRLFLKHARMTQNEGTRGTLTWLSDYLPRE